MLLMFNIVLLCIRFDSSKSPSSTSTSVELVKRSIFSSKYQLLFSSNTVMNKNLCCFAISSAKVPVYTILKEYFRTAIAVDLDKLK